MIRIRFRLTEREYRAARAEAKRLGISLTELVRRSLGSIIRGIGEPEWMRYAGMVRSFATDSESVDDVVYLKRD